jgi:TPR repeat protein
MERAAQLEHAAAQYDLAAFYKEGRGVPKDEQKAVYWLGKAADAGLTNAELEYGIALYLGKGVKKDETAGFSMLRRAAEKGNPVAQNRLAHAFAQGRGTKSDAVAAVKWHLLSRQSGVTDFNLDKLHAAVTPEERTAAEKAAYDWQQETAALLD